MRPSVDRPVSHRARAFVLLCAFWFVSISGCATHRGGPAKAFRPTDRPGVRLVFDSSVIRTSRADFDSVIVVGLARNASEDTLRLCCRFAFEGGFHSATACAGLERPPVFYLIGPSRIGSDPLDCRLVVLGPGAIFADSVRFSLYRPDFVPCPGKVQLRGALWVGQPGQSFAEATNLSPSAVEVAIDVP